jgi:outer membrane protein OmpA-like peptidoglycan-associated protein
MLTNRVLTLAGGLSLAGLLAACSATPPPQTAEAPPPAYTVTQTPTQTEYAVPDLLLFATDSAEVLPGGQRVIVDIATAARDRGGMVEVAGYTDTTGSPDHNQRLSEARAQAVAGAMAQAGIEPSRIQARGFGETELAVLTGDNTDEARNRRVVVRVAKN